MAIVKNPPLHFEVRIWKLLPLDHTHLLLFQELVYSHFRKHASYIVTQMQQYLDEEEKGTNNSESNSSPVEESSSSSSSSSSAPFAVKSPSSGFLKALKALLPKIKDSFSFLL